ncbi:uncharacterized protein LOC115898602 [Rhinopithecus roxellana]|uniref:uncharacterized protein LOC115898602 n=1 Tax=Rhinopithecus roxellana TaxID=61622 RepID=UPI0012373340|nr:uncharacterized protein LOC115898602 [Rhinopithecus roxellana]
MREPRLISDGGGGSFAGVRSAAGRDWRPFWPGGFRPSRLAQPGFPSGGPGGIWCLRACEQGVERGPGMWEGAARRGGGGLRSGLWRRPLLCGAGRRCGSLPGDGGSGAGEGLERRMEWASCFSPVPSADLFASAQGPQGPQARRRGRGGCVSGVESFVTQKIGEEWGWGGEAGMGRWALEIEVRRGGEVREPARPFLLLAWPRLSLCGELAGSPAFFWSRGVIAGCGSVFMLVTLIQESAIGKTPSLGGK